jgi:hypothetical protein
MPTPGVTTSSGSGITFSMTRDESAERGGNEVTGLVWMRAYVVEETSWNLIDGATFVGPGRHWVGIPGESRVHDASDTTVKTEIWMGDTPRTDIPGATFECHAVVISTN